MYNDPKPSRRKPHEDRVRKFRLHIGKGENAMFRVIGLGLRPRGNTSLESSCIYVSPVFFI